MQYSACTNLTNLSDVQDVLQDVFIKLFKNRKPFADRNHEKAWIIRVTVNICRDYNKSFWRTNVDLVQDQIINVRDRVENNEVIAAVRSIHTYPGHRQHCHIYLCTGFIIPCDFHGSQRNRDFRYVR